MKNTRKRIGLVALATLLAAGSGVLYADSDDNDRKPESSNRYLAQAPGYPLSDVRWKVTDVVFDPDGRLSMLQHVVPVKDMAAFGSVTSGITANGLKLASVDAVYNAYDAEVREPHYHFTQRFSVSN